MCLKTTKEEGMLSVGFISILGIVPVVLLLLIIAVIFAARSRSRNLDDPENQQEGGKRMIKTVYTYLILFATLMMTIGGSVASFMAVADLVSPPSYYMSYEDYKRGYVAPKEYMDSKQLQAPTEVKTEEQLQQGYQALVSQEKIRARERALNSLIKSFGWIVIPLPVFLYYQRRLRHE
jgi:heme/copper-type cytochrome/quinol oxidase subunit 2